MMFLYRSSRLRGKCTCPSGSACYNRISCDPAHVVTDPPPARPPPSSYTKATLSTSTVHTASPTSPLLSPSAAPRPSCGRASDCVDLVSRDWYCDRCSDRCEASVAQLASRTQGLGYHQCSQRGMFNVRGRWTCLDHCLTVRKVRPVGVYGAYPDTFEMLRGRDAASKSSPKPSPKGRYIRHDHQ
jgi:hypothetical protein